MIEYLKQDNAVYHMDISGLQLMQIAKSKHYPIKEQPPITKVQASDNWFKVMDFFQAIQNCYYLISVHLSDNELLS